LWNNDLTILPGSIGDIPRLKILGVRKSFTQVSKANY